MKLETDDLITEAFVENPDVFAISVRVVDAKRERKKILQVEKKIPQYNFWNKDGHAGEEDLHILTYTFTHSLTIAVCIHTNILTLNIHLHLVTRMHSVLPTFPPSFIQPF